MKKPKEMPLKLVKGGRGKYQASGKSHHTLTKALLVLRWIYTSTTKGQTTSAYGSFNANDDTSFRTHVSDLSADYELEIPRKYVTNTATGIRYKEYWLSDADVVKVEKILKIKT